MLQALIYCCKDLNKSLQHYSLPASHRGEHAAGRLFTAAARAAAQTDAPALARTAWLQPADLEFSVGDFVVVLFPRDGPVDLKLYLAKVIRIGPDLEAPLRTDLVVELEYWPTSKDGFPRFLAPDPHNVQVWKEAQVFWPFLHRVEPPKPSTELAAGGLPAHRRNHELVATDKSYIENTLRTQLRH